MDVVILIIGLFIGSFLNICIDKIPRDELIIFPQSHYKKCESKLKIKDIIPILSYVVSMGRCKSCESRISIKYPIVEILNAILYLMIYLKFGLSLNFIGYSFLASLLIVTSFIDLECKYIYSSTVNLGSVLGIIYVIIGLYTKETSVINNFIGGLVGYLIVYLIVIITKGMGQGDAEIAGLCGLFIGIKGILISLYIAIILGGLVASIYLVFNFKDRKNEIAFSQYIAIGTLICILTGEKIFSLYIGFFI